MIFELQEQKIKDQQSFIDALLLVLQCVGESEGTLFQNDWKHYGIGAEMEQRICNAIECKALASWNEAVRMLKND